MIKNKKFLLTSCLAVGSLVMISVPLTILQSSCSNSSNNLSELPKTDTSHITTINEAINFSNDYLNKYYTFDHLKNDVINSAKYHEYIANKKHPNDKVKIVMDIGYVKDHLDYVVQIISDNNTSIKTIAQFYFTNIKLKPYLTLNADNSISLSFYFSFDNLNTYNSLDDLKYNNKNWKDATIANLQYQIGINNYPLEQINIFSIASVPNNNHIISYKTDLVYTIIPFSIPLKFENIVSTQQDILVIEN